MTKQQSRGRVGVAVAAGISLTLYGLASWIEAAEGPADFGFNETLSWSRMLGALPLASWRDVAQLHLPLFCLVALLGMVGALAWAALPLRPNRELQRLQIALVWTNTLFLVLTGGWLCVIALPFELVGSHDGECLEDGGLRMMVVGAWTIQCLIASWSIRHSAAAPHSLAAKHA
ncbi:MAG TPA: hypothetical protein VM509_14280 [Planctomycetota bacterium]|nr:hypothetical protein [Planctomycetota bacterium]